MSSGFVRTEVISSADGINHEVSEKIENEEAERLRRRHEQDGQKSLYDQLAEQKEKMQEAYDEQTKLIFAPPRGLALRRLRRRFFRRFPRPRERGEDVVDALRRRGVGRGGRRCGVGGRVRRRGRLPLLRHPFRVAGPLCYVWSRRA